MKEVEAVLNKGNKNGHGKKSVKKSKVSYEQQVNQMNMLFEQGKYSELANELIKANSSFLKTKEGENPIELFFAGFFRKDLSKKPVKMKSRVEKEEVADDNYYPMDPGREEGTKKLIRELFRLMCQNVVPCIPIYEDWLRKLRNGEVKHAETIKDNEKIVGKLALDLTTRTNQNGLFVADSQNIFRAIKKGLFDNKVLLDSIPGVDKFMDIEGEVKNEFLSKLDDEKKGKYDLLHRELAGEDRVSSTGFGVKANPHPDESNLFAILPENLGKKQVKLTKEEKKATIEDCQKKIRNCREFLEYVNDMIQDVKDMLEKLEEYEAGHGKSASYIALHDEMVNFTKLGQNFKYKNKYNKFEYYTILSQKVVELAVEQLKKTAEAYEKAHTGFTNIFNSNWGYGRERLKISRDLIKLTSNGKQYLQRYAKFGEAPEILIDNLEKQISELKGYDEESDSYDEEDLSIIDTNTKKIKLGNMEEQDPDYLSISEVNNKLLPDKLVLPKLGDTRNERFENYIKSHTIEGGYTTTDRDKMERAISKVLAAQSMKIQGMEYNESKIRDYAKKIASCYSIKRLSKSQLNNILKNKNTVYRFGDKQREQLYEIKNGTKEDFSKDMSRLHKACIKNDKLSEEYKNVMKCVKNAADLSKGIPAGGKEYKAYREACMNILFRASIFLKSDAAKKTDDLSKECFSNVLDAVSIVSKYTAGNGRIANERVLDIVATMNKTIKREKDMTWRPADVLCHGVDWAEKAKADRMKKNAETKNEVLSQGKKSSEKNIKIIA